jgi:hypothetical protein
VVSFVVYLNWHFGKIKIPCIISGDKRLMLYPCEWAWVIVLRFRDLTIEISRNCEHEVNLWLQVEHVT